jgi:hypothetical protein
MGIGEEDVDCGKLLALELKPSPTRDPARKIATQIRYLILKKRPLTHNHPLNRNVYCVKGYTHGKPNTNKI